MSYKNHDDWHQIKVLGHKEIEKHSKGINQATETEMML